MSWVWSEEVLASMRVLTCAACGKPSPPSRCGRCGAAFYCGVPCQRLAWPHHKVACVVDAAAPPKETDEERDSLFFNDRCTHGGPPSSSPGCMPLIATITKLAFQLVGEQLEPATQLVTLTRWVLEHKPDDRAPRICASMAADAFADNNYPVSRFFMRAAGFFEGYLAGGQSFLGGLCRRDGDETPPSILAYNAFQIKIRSRSGLLAELRSRATCGCLLPLSKSVAAARKK